MVIERDGQEARVSLIKMSGCDSMSGRKTGEFAPNRDCGMNKDLQGVSQPSARAFVVIADKEFNLWLLKLSVIKRCHIELGMKY